MQRTLVLVILLVTGSVSARELLQRGLRAPCLIQDQVYPFQSEPFAAQAACSFYPLDEARTWRCVPSVDVDSLGFALTAAACKVEKSASVCGRGYGAWPTIADCCAPGGRGAFPQGVYNCAKP